MNKKEITEIKKQLSQENCTITSICGCYVDGEKNKKAVFREAFLALPQEEMLKYFEIFKKALTGTLGKNLLNMEFPSASEQSGGTQEMLLQLRDSELKDDGLLDNFYDRVIEGYQTVDNYLILLIYSAYDVPGQGSDSLAMEDASEEVYKNVLCCICPVHLSKPGLSYYSDENCFKERVRDWVLDKPMLGFLFPAFNERSTDLHSTLYYVANPEELRFDFADAVLGCELPMTAGGQKEIFQQIIEETLGEDCNFESVKEIHEQLNEYVEEKKDEPEPVAIGKKEVINLLAASGVDNDKIEHLESHFEETAGENASLLASNIVNNRKFEIKTPDVVVQVKPDRTELVETKMIDGRPCLVIALSDSVAVNGIPVRMPMEDS